MISKILKILALITAFLVITGISAYLTLTLIIKSEDIVVIPELRGKDVVYALEILTDLGLNIKVAGSEYSSDIPKNHVIFQEPAPGAEIKKDRDLRIIISKGSRTIIMPNFIGLSIQQARIILEENDLRQGALSSTSSLLINKDNIISQVPEKGSMVKRNDYVDFLVSLGQLPDASIMPDFTGLPIDEAILLIEKYDFTLGEIKSVYYDDIPGNVVTGQEPQSGYRILEGSKVNLLINRDPSRKTGKYKAGENGIRLFRYRLEKGFLKRHIRIRLNLFGASSDFFDGHVKPGEEVWVLIPNNQDVTVFLYEDDELIKTKIYDLWSE